MKWFHHMQYKRLALLNISRILCQAQEVFRYEMLGWHVRTSLCVSTVMAFECESCCDDSRQQLMIPYERRTGTIVKSRNRSCSTHAAGGGSKLASCFWIWHGPSQSLCELSSTANDSHCRWINGSKPLACQEGWLHHSCESGRLRWWDTQTFSAGPGGELSGTDKVEPSLCFWCFWIRSTLDKPR